MFYEFVAFLFSQIGAVASQVHKHVTADARMRAVIHVSVYAWKCCTYDSQFVFTLYQLVDVNDMAVFCKDVLLNKYDSMTMVLLL